MVVLPTNFQFSQASLQDYVDCPRRFQLRYVLQLAWPAQEVEPALENELHVQQGAAFHRLIHRHVLGISAEDLSRTVREPDLRRWWHNYLERGPQELPEARHPEAVLSAPLGDCRLVARYDLVAVDAGRRAVIVDWKTSRKRTKREFLAERLQTKVYPCLLVRAGAHLNGGQAIAPEQVEMIYWFADYPEEPARFGYDAAQYEADEAYLDSLVEEIVGLEDFPLTAQDQRCKFCPYRSLCQRGVRAGTLDEAPDAARQAIEDEADAGDALGIDIDFEQIAEIAY
ncbi:MAG: PD-(D/E)XK nuclease family protein [Anaerolineae bacterium]|nr:PD-(D/E)XK nuclease family protein [Anaerolineae bacterium]